MKKHYLIFVLYVIPSLEVLLRNIESVTNMIENGTGFAVLMTTTAFSNTVDIAQVTVWELPE